MATSLSGPRGRRVLMLVEELRWDHVSGIAPIQRPQMAGETARDRAFNLSSVNWSSVQVCRHINWEAFEIPFSYIFSSSRIQYEDKYEQDWIISHSFLVWFSSWHDLVDGGYSEWSDWTSCSQKCGQGMKRRRRYCNNPTPANGGQKCKGARKQVKPCYGKKCQGSCYNSFYTPYN